MAYEEVVFDLVGGFGGGSVDGDELRGGGEVPAECVPDVAAERGIGTGFDGGGDGLGEGTDGGERGEVEAEDVGGGVWVRFEEGLKLRGVGVGGRGIADEEEVGVLGVGGEGGANEA